MNLRTLCILILGVVCLGSTPAFGQFSIPWSTIDCGGGQTSGGTFTLNATIAQPDAATPISGGTFTLTGGFWPGINPCPADFTGDGTLTVQDIFDFLAAWFAGNPAAEFNGDGSVNVGDIFSFLGEWFAGC